MDEAPLLVDHPRDGIARLLLNRPQRHNALDQVLVDALQAAVEAERSRVIVLGSSGRGRFCGGADTSLDDAERAAVSEALYRLYATILDLPRPVVGALDGPAIGGGLQLAIACDLRLAAPAAWLQARGPGHGLAVAAWGLPALVGRSRALDLCLTGRRIDAQEALAIGLVDRVEDDPEAAAIVLAAQVAELDEAAVARVKALVTRFGDPAAALADEAAGNRGWSGTLPPR
jgi:enoyl-CoA hydratase/carnithine racemase